MQVLKNEDYLRDMFYQCKFKGLVQAVEHIDYSQASVDEYVLLRTYKSASLFEMGFAEESFSELRALSESPKIKSHTLLFARARQAYFEGNYALAESYSKKILEVSETTREYLQGVISLANIYWSQQDGANLRKQLQELAGLEDTAVLDQRLSIYLIQANAAMSLSNDVKAAKRRIQQTVREAQPKDWTYFATKALYALTCIYRDQGKDFAVKEVLSLLYCYLDPEESVFLNALVNKKFQGSTPSLREFMKVNQEGSGLTLVDSMQSLHGKPLVSRFFEMLYGYQGFARRSDIAKVLWPSETYQLGVHDPRIFDLAKRMKAVMKTFDGQNVHLLSSGKGYRLVFAQA